jgi:hypothetical protein
VPEVDDVAGPFGALPGVELLALRGWSKEKMSPEPGASDSENTGLVLGSVLNKNKGFNVVPLNVEKMFFESASDVEGPELKMLPASIELGGRPVLAGSDVVVLALDGVSMLAFCGVAAWGSVRVDWVGFVLGALGLASPTGSDDFVGHGASLSVGRGAVGFEFPGLDETCCSPSWSVNCRALSSLSEPLLGAVLMPSSLCPEDSRSRPSEVLMPTSSPPPSTLPRTLDPGFETGATDDASALTGALPLSSV